MQQLRKTVDFLKEERASKFLTRVAKRFLQKPRISSLYVYGYESINAVEINRPILDLEIKEIERDDINCIDELTEIDEWKISRSVTTENLQGEWRCYVGKYQDRIIASVWVFLGSEFEDWYLQRRFRLYPNEAYYYRCFCVPSFRGRGILPYLWGNVVKNIFSEHGKDKGFAITQKTNKSMLRAYEKMGWQIFGGIRVFDISGFRSSCIFGQKILEKSDNRIHFGKAR